VNIPAIANGPSFGFFVFHRRQLALKEISAFAGIGSPSPRSRHRQGEPWRYPRIRIHHIRRQRHLRRRKIAGPWPNVIATGTRFAGVARALESEAAGACPCSFSPKHDSCLDP